MASLPSASEVLNDRALKDGQKFTKFSQLIRAGKMSNKEVVNNVLHLVGI